MSAKKFFYVLLAILALLVALVAGGVVGGNMLLEKQAKKLSTIKSENESIELQKNALLQAKKDVERYSDIEKITKSVVPQDKDQAKTVREIVSIAATNNVPIKSVAFQTSTLGDLKAPAPPAGGTGAKASPDSQIKPVEGIPGVYTLEIQVSSAGKVSYQNFLRFMESLEKNRRTAHVSSINLEPSTDGRQLDFTLTLNAYLKP